MDVKKFLIFWVVGGGRFPFSVLALPKHRLTKALALRKPIGEAGIQRALRKTRRGWSQPTCLRADMHGQAVTAGWVGSVID